MRTITLVFMAGLAGCDAESHAAPPHGRREIQAHMRDHFAAATDLQRAVITGRLATARELAKWLATHPMGELDGWAPYLEEMRYAAREIETARDVPTAGGQLGRLGRA